MKKDLDVKSLLIGFLGAGLLISLISFKSNSDEKESKFQTAIGEKGVVIIDTQSGAYIIAPDIRDIGKVQWIKGDFMNTYKTGKDNKKD